MASTGTARDTSIRTYRAKRNFAVTQEPAPAAPRGKQRAPLFVVQKHRAHRARLHWDFRLEHGGVLWSWAVRKGPSLDPADKRIAAHVEDHPLEYAEFEGTIPDGQYGAGTVELWDRGTWQPLDDPEAGMRKGELRFVLDGKRLHGRFTLVRLKPRPDQRSRQDNWLLIKGHDEAERQGGDARAIEERMAPPKRSGPKRKEAPAEGAVRARLPRRQSPQLASVAAEPPEGNDWVSEIKFDGYRLLCWLDHGNVHLVTRNGLDWTDRLPAVASAVAALGAETLLVDGELVALDGGGRSSFPALQAALSAGKDATLYFFLFDLLHRDGWDLTACRLLDRKRVLFGLADWRGLVRYSDHQLGGAGPLLHEACTMGLEGIICKTAAAPYRAGRGRSWLKVKCHNREEFVVLGWTPPGGSRTGLGSLHLGYYDRQGKLHYAGGVGTGFSDDELARLSRRLGELDSDPPKALKFAGEPLPKDINWVRPDLIAEVQYATWSGSGRVRQAVYMGLREDKMATEVVREAADPKADRKTLGTRAGGRSAASRGTAVAEPPRRNRAIVSASSPKRGSVIVGAVALTHPDRELWPGITKRDLAHYWQVVAAHALPGLAHRPLAVVRCPEGIGGEHFFQKHGHGALPSVVRQGEADGQPYLMIDDADGLVAMAQISAIELHAWGAVEADPLRPDRIVFDLDPGEGVAFGSVARAALDVRDRLQRLGVVSFCRTTGGKGLHVVAPLEPVAGWDVVKQFCRAFAETLSEEQPDRFLSTVRKLDRRGRILIDWLRNGLGATAIASFSPRARDGAGVAMPVAWDEVGPKLDPERFTLRSVPDRLNRRRRDPWESFASLRQRLPDLAAGLRDLSRPAPAERRSHIVTTTKPKRRS
jgi:bifunctional non-homologous end joining protein LigD